MASEGSIREGFLCPICMQDLGSFHKLQQHFETSHTAEDKAVFDQVKGLFSKAKGKILGRNDEQQFPDDSNHFTVKAPERETIILEPQEIGVITSQFDYFKKKRDARIDRFVIESNKVLIRLDKLMTHIKITGKGNSKEFEQSLVPWVNDGDVPFCPTCGDRFNVARRRHHCRLCGSIMCKKCSIFVPFDLAEQLVRTLHESNSTGRQRSRSLLSVPVTEESVVRSCHDCFRVLQNRKDKLDQKYHQPLLVSLYEKLQTSRKSAEALAPKYKEMADSLNSGEERFDLGQANDLRLKLMKVYETVDVLSKKIAAMNTQDEENPPLQTTLNLQSSIRRASHAYLQENMLTLRSLPSLPKLEMLQKERRKEQERRLRRQREEAERERMEAKRLQELERARQERDAAENRKPDKSYSVHNGLVLSDGWTPKNNQDDHTSAHYKDPLLEQINQVQKMLNQAATSGRLEEVKSLTLNLEELQLEYKKKQTRGFGSQGSSLGHRKTASTGAFIVNDNPFLNLKAQAPTKRPQKSHPSNFTNPFVDDSDSLNPFLESPASETGTNPFLQKSTDSNNPFENDSSPVTESEGQSDPIFLQICYISKCLDNAVKAGKRDEAAILRENLRELQALYDTSNSGR